MVTSDERVHDAAHRRDSMSEDRPLGLPPAPFGPKVPHQNRHHPPTTPTYSHPHRPYARLCCLRVGRATAPRRRQRLHSEVGPPPAARGASRRFLSRERRRVRAGICVAGVALAVCGGPGSGPFGAYVAMLALFHQLEYICVAAYRADTLSFDCE